MVHFAQFQHYLHRDINCIHVWDEFNMKPVIFSYYEDKSQESYHRLFRSLVTYANTKKSLFKSTINLKRF